MVLATLSVRDYRLIEKGVRFIFRLSQIDMTSLLSHKDEIAVGGLKRWRNDPVFPWIWDIARWALFIRPLGGLLHF
jgi:hypothetical protein